MDRSSSDSILIKDDSELNDGRKFAFIVNPTSGSGRGLYLISQLNQYLPHKFRNIHHGEDLWIIMKTTHQTHATELAREAVNKGFNVIVSVGGDGTLNEVINGLIKVYQENQDLKFVLGFIPIGTGGDFQRTFKIETFNVRQYMRAILYPKKYSTEIKVIDVGKVVTHNISDRAENERLFINISSCGISGVICHNVNKSSKALGGFVTFCYQLCKQTVLWSNLPIRWRVDGGEWTSGSIFNFVIANGQYFGGGIHVAPQANPFDGIFDIVSFEDIGVASGAPLLPKMYTGTHLNSEKVHTWQGKKIEAEPLNPSAEIFVEADGEVVGVLPATWELLPIGIPFLCPFPNIPSD